MTSKHDARRKLLKSLAAGGGVAVTAKVLPSNWVRPVVDAVVVPAHAVVSGCGGQFCALIGAAAPIFIAINVTGAQVSGAVFVPDAEPLQGEGPCNPDGTFGFEVTNNGQEFDWLEGTIAADCSQINGFFCSDPSCGQNIPFLATPQTCSQAP